MRKAALYGLSVVCVCMILAVSGPAAQRTVSGSGIRSMSATATVGFVGVTTETFQAGVGALAASRACNAEYPSTRLCEWADVFRSIPPPPLDTDVLVGENYEVRPRTTCITSDGGLRCRPGALLPAACCGSNILSSLLLNFDTTSVGCSSSSSLVTSCSQEICLEAQALDSNGMGIQGVVLIFKLQNNVFNGNTFIGEFNPSAVTTDSTGKVLTRFSPAIGPCVTQCSAAEGRICQTELIVTTQGGALQRAPLVLQVSVP